MKKLLTLLLSLLMVFTLFGCNSKKEEPTAAVNEQVVEIHEEVKQEEPVVVEEVKEEAKVEEPVVIEEPKKEETTLNKDVTQMSFWVVFYDQYGNELQREALKYGTIPSYKVDLPAGFEKWVYKKSQKDANISKAITGNTYYQAICHEVKHHSGGSTPTPSVPVPNKGDIIYLNNEGKPYRVLKVDGTKIKVLAMYNASDTNIVFNTDETNTAYSESNIDTYLNTTFYDSLHSDIQEAIVPQTITQNLYNVLFASQDDCISFNRAEANPLYLDKTPQPITVGDRKVFILGVDDIIDYFDGNIIIENDPLLEMFYNKSLSEFSYAPGDVFYEGSNIWLSSKYSGIGEIGVLLISLNATSCTVDMAFPNETPNNDCNVRASFVVDLAGGLEWSTNAPQQR